MLAYVRLSLCALTLQGLLFSSLHPMESRQNFGLIQPCDVFGSPRMPLRPDVPATIFATSDGLFKVITLE